MGTKAAEEKSKAAFAFLAIEIFMKTIIYIDGFNLYYRLLKDQPSKKWLNLRILCEKILNKDNEIVGINYYTAHVSSRVGSDAPKKQKLYLDALATEPLIKSHFGNFQVNKTYARLHLNDENNPKFKPEATTVSIHPNPKRVMILKTEEKGSDVNLGSHLIRDGFLEKYDVQR